MSGFPIRWQALAFCLCGVLFGAGAASAGAPGASAQDARTAGTPTVPETLRAILESRFPDLKIRSVTPAAVPGLYEVVSNLDIAYADASGNYLLVGTLVDTRTRENLTQRRVEALQSIDYGKLPFSDAVKVVKGAGTRQLAVFADPLCPFCRKLEQALQGIDDVTVYTFVMPIEGLHAGAANKAQHIWCAEDRGAAWTRWMLEKLEPAERTCAGDPTVRIQALGDELQVAGTPTMFFPDGTRLAGVPEPAQLDAEISRRQKAAPEPAQMTSANAAASPR